jgi:hypothetical protein
MANCMLPVRAALIYDALSCQPCALRVPVGSS